MCLNTTSMIKMPIAIMTEAIITIVVLLWSSDQVGQDTLLTNSLYTSAK